MIETTYTKKLYFYTKYAYLFEGIILRKYNFIIRQF